MRVLVSGSTGFVGAELTRRLRARGDFVVPVTRRRPDLGEVGIDLESGRLDTSRLPGGTLEGIDASVHLAGSPIIGRWSAAKMERIRSSRVAVGDLIARSLAALDRPPSVHVTGSAVGYYGSRGEELLEESSGAGEGFLPDVCRAWEAAAEPAARAGVRTVAVRTGIVIGPGGMLGPQLPLFRLGLGGRLGDGRQWMSWISLEDEVAVVLRALDDPSLSGPVNATAPNPVRNAEYTEALGRALRRPTVLSVPALAIRLALGDGPANEMLLASQRAVPARLKAAGHAFSHERIEDALAAAL